MYVRKHAFFEVHLTNGFSSLSEFYLRGHFKTDVHYTRSFSMSVKPFETAL